MQFEPSDVEFLFLDGGLVPVGESLAETRTSAESTTNLETTSVNKGSQQMLSRDSHYRIDTIAVSFPHRAEFRLS